MILNLNEERLGRSRDSLQINEPTNYRRTRNARSKRFWNTG